MKYIQYIFLLFLVAILLGCAKETPVPTPTAPETGTVVLKFNHAWGSTYSPFSIGQAMVHPGTAEEITINLLHYYISNIRFAKADGSQYVQPDSYHLVRLNDGSLAELVLTNVPVGAYIDIRYTIGVDAARNLGGTQEGALDPANGMFWDWNTGYIFVKVEGNSPQAVDDAFQYHLGGFSGTANAIRTNTHSFGGTPLQLVKNAEPSIHISVNAARFWHGGLRLADLNFVHAPSSQAATIATNFSNGFLLDRIQN